jgi:lycopene beta-cyclase
LGETVGGSAEHAYQEVYAPDFFKFLHTPWLDGSSDTRLYRNEEVIETRQVKEGTVVVTREREWLAKTVFDARFHGSPKTSRLKDKTSGFLHQTFLGWRIAFPRPVFDPKRVVLMDFRVRSQSGLNFMYVLPYSETEALVESTCFDSEPLAWNRHIAQVQEYILDNFGDDYWIEGEESGNLPMSSKRIRTVIARNFFAVGAAGGAIRPSSGYAFHRIQRTTRELAERIVAGRSLGSVRPSSPKYRFFDSVFLDVVSSDLPGAASHFERLFRGTPSDSLARFMVDEGGILDDARVVLSLPKMPFIREFLRGVTGLRRLLGPVATAYEKVGAALWGAVDRVAHRASVRHIDR